jgi:hypothetical protein
MITPFDQLPVPLSPTRKVHPRIQLLRAAADRIRIFLTTG